MAAAYLTNYIGNNFHNHDDCDDILPMQATLKISTQST